MPIIFPTDDKLKFLLNLDILQHTVRAHPPLRASKSIKQGFYRRV